jgi:RNA polymerase sigma factor (sigma-70 family)
MAVCRHVLRNHHDAEDAFQATFLVLARKAAAIRTRASVASWLHGVAYRISRKAKMSTNRRRRNEARATGRTSDKPVSEAALHELQARLHEEVHRLPEKYRTPFVLCCLTGKSREEAAQELGWKKGTVSSRVAKARTLLQQRLARRGVALSAALCAGMLGQDAAVSAAVAADTARASLRFAAGQAAETVSPQAAAWAEGAMTAMAVTRLQWGAGLLLALGLLAGGAGVTARQALSGRPAAEAADPKTKAAADAAPGSDGAAKNLLNGDLNGDALPAGAQLRLGETRLRPGAHTTHLVFSPDGKRLASWGNYLYHYDRLSVWDAATGKELRTERVEEGSLAALAWCADGRGFAVLTPPRRQNLKDFLVWEFTDRGAANPAPGRPGACLRGVAAIGQEVPEYYGPFAIAPSGKWLTAYHAGGGLQPEAILFKLTPASTVGRLKTVRVLKGLPTDARTLIFSGDNRFLLVFSFKDPQAATLTVTVYETAKGQCLKTFRAPMPLQQGKRMPLALSRDGSLLALGREDGTARLIDVRTGRELRSLAGHKGTVKPRSWGGVSTAAFSPDGKRLVTGGRDNVLTVWDVRAGRALFRLHGHHSWPEATAFTADGQRFASAGQDSLIRLWDAATGKEALRPKGHSHTVWGLEVSRDGRRALTSGWDGTARLWDLRTGAEVRHFSQEAYSQAVFLDDRTIVTHLKGKWQLWDGGTGRPKPLPPGLAGGRGIVFGLSQGGRLLFTAEGRTVTLWAWPAGKRLRQINTGKTVQKVMLTADGRDLLTLSEGVITRWDPKTGQGRGDLPLVVGTYPALAQLTDDGLLVAAGAPTRRPAAMGEENIVVCDVRARRVLSSFPVVNTTPGVFYLLGLAVSADGRTVAVGQSDGNAVLYETATGQVRRVLRGHRESIPGLAFTAADRLVTASLDHTCLVWDVSLRAEAPASAKPVADREWRQLGDARAKTALAALGRLACDPPAAVALLRRHLRPAPGIDDATLDRIVKDLDDDQFKVRQQASRELDRLGEAAVAGVKGRLDGVQSLELRLRLEAFLNKHDNAKPTADRLRETRALQLLEELATPEARTLLRDLARGNPNARRTREAARALARCRRAGR